MSIACQSMWRCVIRPPSENRSGCIDRWKTSAGRMCPSWGRKVEMTPNSIERNAATQNRYRAINEHLAQVYTQFAASTDAEKGVTELLELFCECGQRPSCGERVKVHAVTYERVRADPTTFILAPGHGVAAVEEMVERGDGFLIARNVGRAAEIARAADPRRLVKLQRSSRLVF